MGQIIDILMYIRCCLICKQQRLLDKHYNYKYTKNNIIKGIFILLLLLMQSGQLVICIMTRTSCISMRWWPPLSLTNTLYWLCIVLAHRNNSWRIYVSLLSDTLSSLRASQCLFLLLNDVCLAEK